MDITPAALKSLQTTFSGLFRQGYTGTSPWYSQLCTDVPSSSAQNDYGWMMEIPGLREWLGERQINNLAAHHYSLPNKTFESTVGVRRENIEDDNLGIYTPIFQEFGRRTAKHPDSLVKTLLQTGHTLTCFDGQNFYDTDHPVDILDASKGVQSNYEASGFALTQANFLTARARMMSYKGESGEPLGVGEDLYLHVPPALEGTARRLLEGDTILEVVQEGGQNVGGAGVANITKGMAKVMVTQELAGQDTTWYLHDLAGVIKPFVYQRRRAPAFTSLTSTSEHTFLHNKYLYGVDKRDNAGFALWFKSFKAAA